MRESWLALFKWFNIAFEKLCYLENTVYSLLYSKLVSLLTRFFAQYYNVYEPDSALDQLICNGCFFYFWRLYINLSIGDWLFVPVSRGVRAGLGWVTMNRRFGWLLSCVAWWWLVLIVVADTVISPYGLDCFLRRRFRPMCIKVWLCRFGQLFKKIMQNATGSAMQNKGYYVRTGYVGSFKIFTV